MASAGALASSGCMTLCAADYELALECGGKAKRRHRFGCLWPISSASFAATSQRQIEFQTKAPSTLRSAGAFQSFVAPIDIRSSSTRIYMMKAKIAVKYLGFISILFCFGNLTAQESNASRERRAANPPAAEATVTVNEQFLNSFLTAMFDNLNEPSMPLTMGGAQP